MTEAHVFFACQCWLDLMGLLGIGILTRACRDGRRLLRRFV